MTLIVTKVFFFLCCFDLGLCFIKLCYMLPEILVNREVRPWKKTNTNKILMFTYYQYPFVKLPKFLLKTKIYWKEKQIFYNWYNMLFKSFNFFIYEIGMIVLHFSFSLALKVTILLCSTFRRFSHIEGFQQVSFSLDVWRLLYQLLPKLT